MFARLNIQLAPKKDIEKIWSGNFFRVMKAVEKGKTREVSLR
jgi:membrane dipeptidase